VADTVIEADLPPSKIIGEEGGHWFSLMGTVLPFEITTSAI